jgi:hypothetical protein
MGNCAPTSLELDTNKRARKFGHISRKPTMEGFADGDQV